MLPTPSLTGFWTGPISGDVMTTVTSTAAPPNPNAPSSTNTAHPTNTVQLVFNDNGLLPAALPLPASGFGSSMPLAAVTALNVGETQTITSFTGTQVSPSGATDTQTFQQDNTTTLTVTESALSADHFRVVYDTTSTFLFSFTGTAPGFMGTSSTQTSTGKLTIEATATGDQLAFSMEFNNSGTQSNTNGATTTTQNGTTTGKLEGTLARG